MRKHPLLLVLMLFFCLHVPALGTRLAGSHVWRQADVLTVSWNQSESFDLLRPRIDMCGPVSGITGMEFPLYQGLVGLGMRVTGVDHPFFAKLLALVSAIAALAGMAHIAHRLLGIPLWATAAAGGLSPVMWIYSVKVMPETLALALACWGCLAYWRSRDLGCTSAGIAMGLAAMCGLSAGILVRPYVAGLGCILLFDFLRNMRSPRLAAAPALIGTAALLPVAWWYSSWVPGLIRDHGLSYFYLGDGLFEALAAVSQGQTWRSLGWIVAQEYLGWILVFPFAVGLHQLVRQEATSRFWLLAATGVVTLICVLALTGDHFSPHIYYLIGILPLLAAVVGSGICRLHAAWPRLTVGGLVLATGVVFGAHVSAFRDKSFYRQVPASDWPGRDERVIAQELGGALPFILAATKTRGWVATEEQLQSRAWCLARMQEGATWVLAPLVSGGPYQAFPIRSWLDGHTKAGDVLVPLADPDGAPVYRLPPPSSPTVAP